MNDFGSFKDFYSEAMPPKNEQDTLGIAASFSLTGSYVPSEARCLIEDSLEEAKGSIKAPV